MNSCTNNKKIVLRLKEHLEPSFQMLECLVDCCPDSIWVEINGGFPFWQQVYHTLYWSHRWFREDYNISFQPEDFVKNISPHLDDKIPGFLTREELSTYMVKVRISIEKYFEKLNDEMLFEPVKKGANIAWFDVIMNQIRHIQYHVGHCDSILRQKGVRAVEWIAYGEKE